MIPTSFLSTKCSCEACSSYYRSLTFETPMQELRKRQKSGEQAQQQLQRIDSVRSQEEELSKEEVIRRLRLLGQPITLFGEVSNAAAVHQQ